MSEDDKAALIWLAVEACTTNKEPATRILAMLAERDRKLAEVHSRTMTRAILPDLTPDEEASDE